MRKLLAGIILVCLAAVAMADVVQLKKNHPDTYTVVKGDTLWDISSKFLEDPWKWPEIWQVNPQIKNPHLIYPGDLLKLIYVEEGGQTKPKVVVAERAPVKVIPGQKLLPQVRKSGLEEAIPAIPLEKINAFLSKSRVVQVDVMDAAPYVIAGSDKRLVSGAGDNIYARGDFSDEEKVFGFYRAGETFIDPETKETLGVQALDIGSGRVINVQGDIATLVVNESNQEVRINDRLLPSEEKKVTATFIPKSPDNKVRGKIISVEGGVTQVGVMDIVAINLGEREGLVVGDVLAVHKAGEVVRDSVRNELIQLPDVESGLMIVFRTFGKMSYGLVLQANGPLRTGDKVVNP